ncbi:MAG: hypothetical protein RIQ47_127 [Bacteroidota bacterium]
MERKRIRLIIVVMSLALAGIILLQVNWIRHDFRLKEEQFEQNVSHALNNVVDRLERKEAQSMVSSHLFSINPDSITELMLSDTLNSDFYEVRDTVIELQGESHQVTSPWPEDPESGTVDVNYPSITSDRSFVRIQQRKILRTDSLSRRSISSSQITRIFGDSAEIIIRQNEEKIKARLSKLNEVMQKMAFEFAVNDEDIRQRLKKSNLDSLLKNELKNHNIRLEFDYCVLSNLNNSVLISNVDKPDEALLLSPFKAVLFPNDIVARPDFLLIRFPETFSYFLNSMWVMLLSSTLLTFIIVFGFAYTIQVILRQKKLSDIKSDFINNMTHEFKTPIATISLAVDSLRNPKAASDPEKFNYFTHIIREENRRMNSQVERVLQMAQIDKGELKLRIDPLNFHDVILHGIEQIRLQVESRNGTIIADLNAENPEVYGDNVHLSNIVINLLDNANKYSGESPEIRVETINHPEGIVTRVIDKGIGMTKETQKRIFEKFYRVPTGNRHDIKGFGLGLSYVQFIVNQHRGWIRVDSDLGKGSTFEFFLPHH